MFACRLVLTEVFRTVHREREIHHVRDVSENSEGNLSFSARKQTLEAQPEIQGPGLALFLQVPPRAHSLFSLSVRFLISHVRRMNCTTGLSGPVFLLIFPVH